MSYLDNAIKAVKGSRLEEAMNEVVDNKELNDEYKLEMATIESEGEELLYHLEKGIEYCMHQFSEDISKLDHKAKIINETYGVLADSNDAIIHIINQGKKKVASRLQLAKSKLQCVYA
jgi:hypothetical protein